MTKICECDGYFDEGCLICTPVKKAPLDTPEAVEAMANSCEVTSLAQKQRGLCCGETDCGGTCCAPACLFGETTRDLTNAASMLRRLHQRAVDAERERNQWIANSRENKMIAESNRKEGFMAAHDIALAALLPSDGSIYSEKPLPLISLNEAFRRVAEKLRLAMEE